MIRSQKSTAPTQVKECVEVGFVKAKGQGERGISKRPNVEEGFFSIVKARHVV
jgi:hypothetical protein